MNNVNCPVCQVQAMELVVAHGVSWKDYDCPNCGRFSLTGTAAIMISSDAQVRAALSFLIWESQSNGDVPPSIDRSQVISARALNMPNFMEQLNRLVLYYGNLKKSPGKRHDNEHVNLRAKIGASNLDDVNFVVETAIEYGLLDCANSKQQVSARLTLTGWERYDELKRGAIMSRKAFMAMPFGDPNVRRVYDDVFFPAVELTGFRLFKVDEEPKAGSIINRIRVEILVSRFLIADLTNNNGGAYWEAGFAEGLGKPVIYTCERSFFENKECGVHFDTKQSQTVLWSLDNPEQAKAELKNIIRATLPLEARMEDLLLVG